MLAPTFTQLAAELLPGVSIFHMVDESLIKDTIATGSLTKATARRVLRLIESAQDAGADIALVTCSSIGKAVELSRPLIDIPVLRVDEPMATAAVTNGKRIGVAATLRTTLEPTLQLLERHREEKRQAHRYRSLSVRRCIRSAVGRKTGSTRSIGVAEALQKLMKSVDVVVLAQASMARVVAEMPVNETLILSSPRLAVESVRERLLDPQPAGV